MVFWENLKKSFQRRLSNEKRIFFQKYWLENIKLKLFLKENKYLHAVLKSV
jgi:hypothetical protein